MGAQGSTLAILCLVGRVSAGTFFGALSNFDAVNDTGHEAHGFEIELDGLSSADVSFTFGEPYQRYGNPVVTDLVRGLGVLSGIEVLDVPGATQNGMPASARSAVRSASRPRRIFLAHDLKRGRPAAPPLKARARQPHRARHA